MGLLNARLIAERGAICVVCVLLPAIVGILTAGPDGSLQLFALRVAQFAIPLGLIAFIGCGVLAKQWNLRFAEIIPSDQEAELIAEAAREYATNKADAKLVERAKKAVSGQDGRVVAHYIGLRIADMRRQRAVEAGLHRTPAAVSAPMRGVWALLLLLTTSGIMALLPRALHGDGVGLMFGAMMLLAVPLWATGILVTIIGDDTAARWLQGLLRRGEKDEAAVEVPADDDAEKDDAPVKLRKIDSRKARSWHVDSDAESRPVFRLLLLCLLCVTGGLYMLRTYAPANFEVEETYTAPGTEIVDGGVEIGEEPEPVEPPAPEPPPRVEDPTVREEVLPPDVRPGGRPAYVKPTPPYWQGLEKYGSLVYVEPEQLQASGRELEALQQILAENWPRIEQWFVEAQNRNPRLKGRVAIEMVIQPYGWVSSTTIVESETDEPWFDAGLRDRLDALNFGRARGLALAIIYSIHFG